jgi:hypothetical protein
VRFWFFLRPRVLSIAPANARAGRGTDARDADDLAAALAFALRFQGGKRVHNADELMVEIVAKRLIDRLERAGFVTKWEGQRFEAGFEG